MIGGHDNDLSSTLPCEQVVNRFLKRMSRRWPSAIVHITNDVTDIELVTFISDIPVILSDPQGTVTLCRDEAMKAHLDREGLTLMPDGEGPTILFFWQRGDHCDLDLVTPAAPIEKNFSEWAVEQLSIACDESKPVES